MRKTTVYNVKDLDKLPEDKINTLITIRKRPTREGAPQKTYHGTAYYSAVFDFTPIGGQVSDGANFYVDNVVLTSGIMDPKFYTGAYAKNRLQLTTKYSVCPELGRFFDKVERAWTAATVRALDEVGTNGKKIIPKSQKRKATRLVQRDAKKEEDDDEKIQLNDPIIRFKISFDKYSTTHPVMELRGAPKTIIRDFSSGYIDQQGHKKFPPAMVMNGENKVPLDASNIHMFVTRGSTIKRMRFCFDSVSVSEDWFSLSMVVNDVILEHSSASGPEISDDDLNIQNGSSPFDLLGSSLMLPVPVSNVLTIPSTCTTTTTSSDDSLENAVRDLKV
jgi:hypothetical protein